MTLRRRAGTTSLIKRFRVLDTSATDGSLLTGLLWNTSGLKASYLRDGDVSTTTITLATATAGTWTSGGFVETGLPGVYELGIPDAALASGSDSVIVRVEGAANMPRVDIEIDLTIDAEVTHVDGETATATGTVVFDDLETIEQDRYVFRDDFIGTPDSSLLLHTPPIDKSGFGWQSLAGGTYQIEPSGDGVRLTANLFSAPWALFVVNALAKNYTIRCRMKTESPQAGWVHFRVNPDDESHYSIQWLLGEMRLKYYDGTTSTTLTTVDYDSALSNDTFYWIRVTVEGTTVQAIVEGETDKLLVYEMDQNLNELFAGLGGADIETVVDEFEVLPSAGGGASDTAAIDDLQLTLENVVDNAAAAIASSGSVFRSHLGMAAADLDTQLDAILAASSSSTVILPTGVTTTLRVDGNVIDLFVDETVDIVITVTDPDGNAVDLSAKSLVFVVEDRSQATVAEITSITISGTGNNIATLTVTAPITASARLLRWALRDDAAPNTVYGHGNLKVSYVPDYSG